MVYDSFVAWMSRAQNGAVSCNVSGVDPGPYPQKKTLQLKIIAINCNYQLILFCEYSPINCPISKN
jgi:hypothetical protein